MTPGNFCSFISSNLYQDWMRDQDPETTSRMCNGAAINGNGQILQVARGMAYNNWRSASCTAARFDRLGVVQWLSDMNELTRGFCDDCASVDARHLGLVIGAYSGPQFLDWALGVSDDNEVNKPCVIVGLAMMGRRGELERVLDKFAGDIGFLQTMACQTAIIYGEIETVEMLLQRGVQMDNGLIQMIGAVPSGYMGMLMDEIREIPLPLTMDLVEYFRFYDYIHADFSPSRTNVLLNPFVLLWEVLPGNQDD